MFTIDYSEKGIMESKQGKRASRVNVNVMDFSRVFMWEEIEQVALT